MVNPAVLGTALCILINLAAALAIGVLMYRQQRRGRPEFSVLCLNGIADAGPGLRVALERGRGTDEGGLSWTARVRPPTF